MNIPRGTARTQKGTWWPAKQPGGGYEIQFTCPECGLAAYLDHEIAPTGAVSPSVGCPNEGKGCSFHQNVVLEGWPP